MLLKFSAKCTNFRQVTRSSRNSCKILIQKITYYVCNAFSIAYVVHDKSNITENVAYHVLRKFSPTDGKIPKHDIP